MKTREEKLMSSLNAYPLCLITLQTITMQSSNMHLCTCWILFYHHTRLFGNIQFSWFAVHRAWSLVQEQQRVERNLTGLCLSARPSKECKSSMPHFQTHDETYQRESDNSLIPAPQQACDYKHLCLITL